MAYKSLYRKYRPNKFEDVCGQKYIVRTLTNALLMDKISHAYLFCGTRGTGKTTIAKIFAKSVNCLSPNQKLPCGKCDICNNKNTDEIQDIIEIDAASNTGVDEIRELKNKIKLVPVMCKYKVYIIDEVHMLSIGAFNALLKTLEEPPSHVIFILATTEPQKLPITIISRCQRFDFRKLSLLDIEERLKYISKEENIDVDKECINEIAKLSGGAMRDAIGLLDQLSSFSNKKITMEDIYQICGSVTQETLVKLINAYFDSNINEMLEIIEKIYIDGKDFVKLSEDMLYMFRNIYINMKAPKYYKQKQDSYEKFIDEFAKKTDTKTIEKIIEDFEKMHREIKYSDYPKVLLEICMLRDIKNIGNSTDNSIKNIDNKEEKKLENVSKNNFQLKKEMKNENTKTIEIVSSEYTMETKIDFHDSINEYKKVLINNTIAVATAKDKKNVQKIFNDLDKYILNKKYKVSATILKDANIAAASKDHILLTYKYVSMVEDNDANVVSITKLVNEILNEEYKIVAITDEEWGEIRPYYIELKKKNGSIKLLEEKDAENNFDKMSNKNEEFNDIINTFGRELVEMEG